MDLEFAQDVASGLSRNDKRLSSKYFYDDRGSAIFNEIMQMPEYYLTDSEYEILAQQSGKIIEAVAFDRPFNIVELGAGDGSKTFKLLEFLAREQIDFYYVPIDISQGAMDKLVKNLGQRLPGLSIHPRVGDYFDILARENTRTGIPSLLLFLGSNIGNYGPEQATELMGLLSTNMKPGDKLLLGMDLKKKADTVLSAYDDPHGITKRFNLNLLQRINRELEADFDLDSFDFRCHYNADTGELNSYLVSLTDQTAYLKKLDHKVHFAQNETIWTELSKKYDFEEIEHLANLSGFRVQRHFLDRKRYFTDCLLEKR